MVKIRIKTKEEFKRDNLWDYDNNCPNMWNRQGKMDYLFGATIEVMKISERIKRYKLTDNSKWIIYEEFIAEFIEDDNVISNLFDEISKKENEVYKAKSAFKKTLMKEFKEIKDVYHYDFYPVIILEDSTHIRFKEYKCDLYFEYYSKSGCIEGTNVEEIIRQTKEKIDRLEKYLELGKKIHKAIIGKELDVNKCNIYKQLEKLKGN
jgi:hypothetical protein